MASGTFLPPGLSRSIVKIESGGTDNYVMTAVDGETIQGEDKLTFDGTNLALGADTKTFIGHTAAVLVSGSTSPSLQVLGNHDDGHDTSASVIRFNDDTAGGQIYLGKSKSNTVGTAAVISDADTIGAILFVGADNTDVKSTAARISAQVDGTAGSNDMPGRLVFETTPDSGTGTSPNERMRISANGIITIGGGISQDTAVIFDNAGTDYHIGIDQTADDLVIGVGTGLGTTTAMSISSDLHIGIGAAPSTTQYIEISPTWTATAGNADTARIGGTLTPGGANNLTGLFISPTLNRYSSGTHSRFVSLDVRAPTIEAIDGKATVTSVALIHLRTDASGGGTNNYQIWDSTNSAFLSTAGVWTDASHGDVKIHSPADLDIMPELLAQLNLKQYHRRSPLYDSDGQVMENEDGSTIWTDAVHSDDSYLRYGPLAEEVPEFLATADRKGIGAGYTAGFLIGVAQNHDARIEALEKALGV